MERIVVFTEPVSPITEAYRGLCTNVLAELGEKKAIEIASVSANADASVVVANLAVAMAQTTKRVLLVDCNFRKPNQHTLFGLLNRGLSECIETSESFTSFVQETAQRNLQVLTAGSTVLNPVEILLSDAMQNILNDTKASYDVVLLDAPVIDTVSDAVTFGVRTDGVLLVLADKEDKMEQALKVKESFIQAGVEILGCILNKVK